jgi:hypothetical protein
MFIDKSPCFYYLFFYNFVVGISLSPVIFAFELAVILVFLKVPQISNEAPVSKIKVIPMGIVFSVETLSLSQFH